MNTETHKTALITGASSGIGIDIAMEFAKRRINLILLARREDKLKEVQKNILEKHPDLKVDIMVQDLTAPDAVEKITVSPLLPQRPLDFLVNNAGFGLRGKFHELSRSKQVDMITLNVSRLTELSHCFLPGMLQQNSGGILNVASVAAFQPGPMMSVYFATKAFVLFLTEGIHEEIKDSDVLISALCPGPTESEFGKVADMEGTRLFDHGVMRSAEVARLGVEGFFEGEAVVITGLKNKVLAQSSRLTPRAWVRKIAMFLQK